jgi:hypothetical protein
MYPSYETIAAQSGHYPFVEVYQFFSADVYQLQVPATRVAYARRAAVSSAQVSADGALALNVPSSDNTNLSVSKVMRELAIASAPT